jgi:RNA polymerase sigma-70 factor, ECF subfamily
MSSAQALARDFEQHRRHLLGLAYRMLGSHAEAEDAVQEAWLRWSEVGRVSVDHPRAYLSQTVTRLCLDRLKSAQARREVYVGPWLPEPVLEDEDLLQPGPNAAGEFAEDLSYAFMLALERLSPLERAAFLLHDVFDASYTELAQTLGRSEASCRQLATRARAHVRESRPRQAVPVAEGRRLADAFLHAVHSGDAAALKALLAEDARFVSDGGGRVAAVGIPVLGRERVIKVLVGLALKHPLPADSTVHATRVNGLPGCVIRAADGSAIQTVAVEVDNSRINAVYVVRNPDKLRHLADRDTH